MPDETIAALAELGEVLRPIYVRLKKAGHFADMDDNNKASDKNTNRHRDNTGD